MTTSPRIGVISDTHGLLRREALIALEGVDHILHAGDVGEPSILDALGAIAAVTAIRGNIDVGGPCSHLPDTEVVTLHGHTFYMLHDRHALDLNPSAAGFAAIISGHSHRPLIEWRQGVLYLNPGSAGPRRFSLPISLAVITIRGGALEPELVTLPQA
ncbi:MAG TPA: metallophosphoesterase family protein [Acidobacteriaceae bacterium]|nr:metallophosphoesterase family protein [Acidobacteriaceae bacterium]